MNKPEATRRMVQWAVELNQFDIKYHPKTTIKAQALAELVAKFTILDEEEIQHELDRWTIQTDGLST